jgi:amidase
MGEAERTVRAALERIQAREPEVGAWVWLDPQAALVQARALDAGSPRGPLHGVPVGIKDIIATADMPTAYGSPIYAGHRPAWDAACVAAIRAAGGIVMGKTVTTEFAASHPGKTRNPHDLARTPGGSSSGSAAAVADGMVPAALGTQTGGSVIRPASFCGVVGFKPSFGRVSRHGVKPLSESLDTVGVLAASVHQAALLAGVLARRSDWSEVRAEKPRRIGLWRTFEWQQASPDAAAALERATRLAEAAGATVAEVRMPPALAALDETHHAIERFEMADSLAYELQHHRDRVSPRLRARVEEGAAIPAAAYDDAQRRAVTYREAMHAVFADLDVLLTPATPGEAPAGLESTGSAVFNRGWTLLHLPCITVPGMRGARGLPLGVQLVGAAGADARLLAFAAWMEDLMRKQ